MIKKSPQALLALFCSMLFFACTKNDYIPASGGELPGNYIIIRADGTISPAFLTVASGSSIIFVNNDVKPHNIMSSDSVSIVSKNIPSKGFYKLKNDALVGSFPYKCLIDSTIKGLIVFTP